jgi:hypothetical protein
VLNLPLSGQRKGYDRHVDDVNLACKPYVISLSSQSVTRKQSGLRTGGAGRHSRCYNLGLFEEQLGKEDSSLTFVRRCFIILDGFVREGRLLVPR